MAVFPEGFKQMIYTRLLLCFLVFISIAACTEQGKKSGGPVQHGKFAGQKDPASMAAVPAIKPADPEDKPVSGDGKFPSGTTHVWRGFEQGRCGTRLYLVDPDGQRIDFATPRDFADPLITRTIMTGENNQRGAVHPNAIFENYGGNRLVAYECDGDRQVTITPADSNRYLFVINGRAVLKLMRSNAPELPTTPIKLLEHLELFNDQLPPTESGKHP